MRAGPYDGTNGFIGRRRETWAGTPALSHPVVLCTMLWCSMRPSPDGEQALSHAFGIRSLNHESSKLLFGINYPVCGIHESKRRQTKTLSGWGKHLCPTSGFHGRKISWELHPFPIPLQWGRGVIQLPESENWASLFSSIPLILDMNHLQVSQKPQWKGGTFCNDGMDKSI
jgi:hypothetical protein